jgi:hypothetical protein
MPLSHILEQLDSTLFTAYYREIRIESKRQMSRDGDSKKVIVPWRRELER